MGKFLNLVIFCLYINTGIAAQAQKPFTREAELISYAKKTMGEKYHSQPPTLFFLIQNSYCLKLCDTGLVKTLSYFIKKNTDLHFDLVHTFPADVNFGPTGKLSQLNNLSVYCDSIQQFQKMGLDMPEHKLFLLKNDRIICWVGINRPNRKAILKKIRAYKKAGMFTVENAKSF